MPTTTSPLRVLLVEDDDAYARMLQTMIGPAGPLSLQRVSTLSGALCAIENDAIDAILLDLGLPDSFGIDTVDRLRELVGERIPIVVLTSRDDDEIGVQAVHRGAQDYLIKGTTDAQLLARAVRYAHERAEWRRQTLEREGELRQAQKMEAIGRLAGGVAHDFNNVLTAIFGYTDLLLEQFTAGDPRRDDVVEIRRSAERAASLTRQLLAFSRKQMMQPRVVNLNSVIDSLSKLLERLIGEDVVLDMAAGADLWDVRADPGQIEQILMNLVANGRDAMPEGGRLTITTANVVVEHEDQKNRPGLRAGAYVTIAVSDTGSGVPEHIRAHMFEPFFTTKEQGKGTGLGLATVYGIVKQNGGGVYVDSEEGKGTRFVIYLPRVPSDRAISSP
jgi:two-component system, cell cycle sensor histidine kinase and response regulator CckA